MCQFRIVGRMDEIMNLPRFLDYVDDKTQKMTHEELEMFIHEFARKLSENKRDGFIALIDSLCVADEGHAFHKEESDGKNQVIEQINQIIPKLEEINSGAVCLDSEYNEEWDDWYNSDDEVILFSDPEDLLYDVREAINLIHQCIDMELFEEGYKLSETVSYLEISSEGDYNDYDGAPLGIEDLFEQDLISGNFDDYVKETIYLAYLGNPLNNRAEEIYDLFDHISGTRVKLEDILKMGNHELPEFDDFLHSWIEYLGMQKSRCASELLKEAQSMLRDEFTQLEYARKYVDVHPELYLQVLQMQTKAGEENERLAVGLEAMDAVSVELKVRSQIALWTAYYANKLCKFDVSEKCWIEALRSDPSIINYIRIKFLPWDAEQYSDKVWNIVRSAFEEKQISENDYCVVLFFEKRFDEMEKLGMSVKKNLGWSFTFMKEGLALLLLLMYRGDHICSAGMRSMLEKALYACHFKKEILYFGTDESSDKSDEDIFYDLFEKWKATVSFSEDQVNQWMTKIDHWIRRRVTGIMGANKRNYYGECASYIAALGEVLESQGQAHAKANIMEKYRLEYSRRRAFHEALRGYGMKK